jgi:hypothetical protein
MLSKRIFVIAVAIGACCALATAQQPSPAREAGIEARVDRLQAHVERIESVRAIKRLQYAYGHYVELGLWNDFADLFTDDAATNYQQGARGRTQIRQLFFDQVGQGKLGLADGRIYPHILFQPVISLSPDGKTAKGRWRILAMLGGLGSTASWYSGVYENEYVLEGGVWKISLLRSEPKVTAAYTATGWRDSGRRVPFHYTSASVSALMPEASGRNASAGGATPSLASLADRVNQLALKAARLNDQAEVTNLQDTYGYAVDRKLWDQVAPLFADDGTLELGLQGVYVGKASIRRALDQFGPQGLRDGELHDHAYLQTLVTVAPDGRTAKARGVELIMSSAPGGRNGELSEGIFENSFVKQNGSWKIQSVRFYPRMIVDAAAGWAKSSKPAPGPSKEFPPDRPATSSYEIYPKFAVAPFHFDNPVTGKPPQYPAGVQAARSTMGNAAAPAAPQIRNTAELEARLAEVERSVIVAEAYDAAENLIGASGYYLDDAPGDIAGLFARGARPPDPASPSAFANQIMQSVIEVSPDGKSAKVRARQLNPGGVSGGAGSWMAGTLEGQIVTQDGAWKFQTLGSTSRWSAPFPGGWARVP